MAAGLPVITEFCHAQGEASTRIAAHLWNLFDTHSTKWCLACAISCDTYYVAYSLHS